MRPSQHQFTEKSTNDVLMTFSTLSASDRQRCCDGLITPKYALNSVSLIKCDNVPEIIFFILALCLKRTRDFFHPFLARLQENSREKTFPFFSLSLSFESDSIAQERFFARFWQSSTCCRET